MIELSAKEIKDIEYDLIKKFDTICKENDIKYFLGYGTLLGAVRHKGFIPWDDDIDVWMMREDYDKFCSVIKKLEDKSISYLSAQTEDKSYYAYGKFCDARTKLIFPNSENIPGLGVFVDVFPLDNVPENKSKTKKFFRKQELLFQERIASITKKHVKRKGFIKNLLAFILHVASRFMNVFKIVRKIDKNAKKYNGISTPVCACNVMVPKVFKKEYFESSIDCAFEDSMLPIPVGADEVLKIQYGDYMKLPPEEQRVYKHGFKAYLIEESTKA